MKHSQNPIDWQYVLNITSNKPEVAKELIAMFGAELPHVKKNINKALEQQDYAALLSHIHKLHGSCCYCGVARLRELAATLENTLKINKHAAVSAQVETINEEIDAILRFMADQAIT